MSIVTNSDFISLITIKGRNHATNHQIHYLKDLLFFTVMESLIIIPIQEETPHKPDLFI